MAEREYFTNNAATTLNGAINSSVTSITLTSGTLFPAKQFRLLIDSEIMYCTVRSSNTLTVIRGSEGTTAASHSNLAVVKHILTAGALEQVKLDLLAIHGMGRVPTTGNTYGDEFDDDTFSGWTTVIGGGVTLNTIEKDHFLSSTITTGSVGQWTAYMKDTGGNLSIGNSISTCFRIFFPDSGFPHSSIIMADGVTYGSGEQMNFGFSIKENEFVLRRTPGYLAQVSGTASQSLYHPANSHYDMHLRLTYKGSGLYDGETSLDGINWYKAFSNNGGNATVGTMVPRYIGIGFTTWNSVFNSAHSFRYFRTNF
jgi:hypothetical protein